VASFESGFSDVQQAADGVARAAAQIVGAARQLHKSAVEGDIGRIQRTAERLSTTLEAVR